MFKIHFLQYQTSSTLVSDYKYYYYWNTWTCLSVNFCFSITSVLWCYENFLILHTHLHTETHTAIAYQLWLIWPERENKDITMTRRLFDLTISSPWFSDMRYYDLWKWKTWYIHSCYDRTKVTKSNCRS